MAIQMRRGLKKDFDPNKMLPGEWAVSIDTSTSNQIVWMCFAAGVCKRMGTYEDFVSQIAEATDEIKTQYETTFNEILDEIKLLADTVADDAESVATVKTSIIDTYLPEIEDALAEIQAAVKTTNDNVNKSANNVTLSQSYAKGGTESRENEDVDNAKYYYEQAKKISQGMSGLIPMGTITFADLSNTDNQVAKYMFNISDAFTTDDTFKEGAGYHYGAGTNVFRTEDGYWDAMAGSTVTGVKGANESTYRQGNVSLSAEDVGAVATGADTADNTIAFTNRDIASPTTWLETDALQSGEKHSSLLEKISSMFRNVRYLFARIGSEDVSELGDTLSSAILKAAEQGGGTASDVTYDNTTSALESIDAQGAIDEIKGMVDETNNNLSALYNHNERVAISQFPYTAPSNGLVRLTLFKNNSTTSWNAMVYVNGSITGYFIGTTLPYHSQTFELRVRKGDVINYMVESGGETYIGAYSEFVAD